MPFKLTKRQERTLYPLSRQSVLILGAGREGWSTYQFLRRAFPRKILSVADQADSNTWAAAWREAAATDSGLRLYAGENYLSQLEKFDVIFKSPGIVPTLPELQTWLEEPRHILTSNTALFLALCPGKTIGVTGTKGKSTTASLIFHVLSRNGVKSVLLGNIGVPALSALAEINNKTAVVMELSSHQLQDLRVSPHIAVVQNITSEHLDYYETTKKYVEAKKNIVAWQKRGDFVIYNPDFVVPARFAKSSQATPLTFSLSDDDAQTVAFCQDKTVWYRDFSSEVPKLESVANLKLAKLKGRHNRQNILPAVIVAKLFGLDGAQINAALKTFSPLRHRLEWAGKVDGADFYNDSLATMPEAMLAALQVFVKKPVILLAGGFERHQDYTAVAAYIAAHHSVREVILFPTTGERLRQNIIDAVQKMNKNKSSPENGDIISKKQQLKKTEFGNLPNFHQVQQMPQAVALAAKLAQKIHGESVVLLSPGAASFGIFKDYADRGDQFVAAVKNLL